MGFLKKKPAVKVSSGGELTRSTSTSKVSSSAALSPSSAASAPAIIDEERDDGATSKSSMRRANTGDVSKKVEAPASGKKESRDKVASKSTPAGTAGVASKPKKKSSTGAAGERLGRPSSAPAAVSAKTKTVTKTKDEVKRKPLSSSKTKDGSAPAASEPKKKSTGTEKKAGSEKKTKATSSRSRSASRGLGGKSRGRSITPTTPKGGKPAAASAKKTTATKKSSALSASGKSKKTDATPKISNGKSKPQTKKVSKGSSNRHASRSRSKSRSKKDKRSSSRSRASTGSNIKKRLQEHYDEETSVSSCGSGSSYSSSDYDDEYGTEIESAVFSNESGSFSSYGYTDEDNSYDTGFSASLDTHEELGTELSPRSFKSGGTAGYSTSFDSNTMENTTGMGSSTIENTTAGSTMLSSFKSGGKKSPVKRTISSKAKKGLSSALGNIAEKTKKDKDKDQSSTTAADATANKASEASTTPDAGGENKETRASPDTIQTEIGDVSKAETTTTWTSGSKGIGAKSHASSTYADFMKKMEEFKVKNPEHQLVMQVAEHGNVEKLLLQELSYIPTPDKPNDIIIKVEASTITLQDCMIRRGKWYEMQSLPFVPGSDVVGTIHILGEEAMKKSTFQVGDKVAALVPSGGNAKYISVPYYQIIRVPNETDSAVALCLSSTYVPAREALDHARKLNTPFTGANILVIGGNGPSGLATIELALLEGANVFTTADERHHEYLTNLGAKCFPIDPAKWLPTLQGKMDAVLDSVCLDGYDSSSLALNPAGMLVCTGMSAVYTQGQIRAFGMRDVRDYKAAYCRMRAKYFSNNTVYYDRMERYANATNEYAQHFRYLCHLASKDTITPLVSSQSPLNKVASVQKAIEHGDTNYGVCICTPWTTAIESSEENEPKEVE